MLSISSCTCFGAKMFCIPGWNAGSAYGHPAQNAVPSNPLRLPTTRPAPGERGASGLPQTRSARHRPPVCLAAPKQGPKASPVRTPATAVIATVSPNAGLLLNLIVCHSVILSPDAAGWCLRPRHVGCRHCSRRTARQTDREKPRAAAVQNAASLHLSADRAARERGTGFILYRIFASTERDSCVPRPGPSDPVHIVGDKAARHQILVAADHDRVGAGLDVHHV